MKFFLPHKRIVPDKLRVFMEVPRITGGFSLTSRLGNAVCWLLAQSSKINKPLQINLQGLL